MHDVTTVPASMGNTLTGYVTADTVQYLGGPDYYNELLVSVSENPTDAQHVTDVAHAITERFKKDGTISPAQIAIYNPGHHFAWQITQGVIFILTLLGWMTVLLSTFLIVNTIVALISQHTRQIGIMKAIGGGTGQILRMYLALLLVFSVIALGLSIPLSGWAAQLTGRFLANYLNYNQGPLTFDTPTLITQAILAFLAPLLAALIPLLNGLRIPVREALGSYGIGNAPARKMRAGLHLDFLPRPVLISMRNAMRKKARLALTLGALLLGGAIFIAVFNLWLSFDQTMRDVQGYFLADINFTFTGPHYLEDVRSIAMKNPSVTGVEGWMTADAQVLSADGKNSNEVAFLAPPSNSTLIQPIITAGRWLTPFDKNAVVIGNQLLKIRPDLKVGDWITIKLQNEQKQWQIIGIYRLPGNINPPLLYTNYATSARCCTNRNQVYSLAVITSQHDAAAQKAISNTLEQAFRQTEYPGGVHPAGRGLDGPAKEPDRYPGVFHADHGDPDRQRGRAGADGHDEHQCDGTHARDRRDARHRRSRPGYPNDRDRRGAGGGPGKLAGGGAALYPGHLHADLRRRHLPVPIAPAGHVQCHWLAGLADGHPAGGHALQRHPGLAGLPIDGEGYAGV